MSHGQLLEVGTCRHLEVGEAFGQQVIAEMRIESAHHVGEGFEAHVGHGIFLRHDEHLLQHLGKAQPAFHAIDRHRTTVGSEQSADEIEQGGLAGAVLPQQSVDPTGVQLQGEVAEHLVLAALIVKTKVSYINHIVLTFNC